MRIKNISCTQFAGVRDRDVPLSDGINVVFGKNESGKSTLVNLLSRVLFQSAKLDKRQDKDKNFFEGYFPTATRSGVAGDFIDGKIVLEAPDGTYTLSKEWGADASCRLSTPDGVIRDQKRIDEILKQVLIYGEGVYTDMLFSSQSNTDVSLQSILNAAKRTDAKQELTDIVSKAFAQSCGVSVDSIEQEIEKKIDELAGKRWDIERQAPKYKAERWTNGLGNVLRAYYALEDAGAELAEISRLENETDRAANEYKDKDAAVQTAQQAYDRFNSFSSKLESQSQRKRVIEQLEKEMAKINEALVSWPKINSALDRARELRAERTSRNVIDVWNAVHTIRSEITAQDAQTAALPLPTQDEFDEVRRAQREITSLENKLCGMNLSAAINMLGGNSVEVTCVRTGERVDVSDGVANITEAVIIEIPDVMRMELSPSDVDVAAVEGRIEKCRRIVADIFAKYKASSLEELEGYARKIKDTQAKLEKVSTRLIHIMNGVTMEELEELYRAAGDVGRTKEEIDSEIFALCGGDDVEKFITRNETLAQGYADSYGDINGLKARAFDVSTELGDARSSAADVDDVPSEYLDISDPAAHLEALQNALKTAQTAREAALTKKTACASRLETYRENISGDPVAKVESAQRELDEQKTLLDHWVNIREVFHRQKESLSGSPMQDIADRFAYYLAAISGGRVSSEFPEADKLNMKIFTNDKSVDYAKLSEGTKETVSLAFRLAVLDHLFPEGGGVIVLDDPFTDMDADRAAQSCELLRQCAERHQVIFLTCREDYIDALGGNLINF